MMLWKSTDHKTWQDVLDTYWDVVTQVDALQKDKAKRKLLRLDRWYFEEFPAIIATGSMPQTDLVTLVDWKLTRGKFRPRLLQFSKDAPANQVKDASIRAYNTLIKPSSGSLKASGKSKNTASPQSAGHDAIKKALAALTELKGVGPATASAILSAIDPSIPFMSDEALNAACGCREYTVKQALELTDALRKKAVELTRSSGGEKVWTARDVERCLFAEGGKNKLAAKSAGGGKKEAKGGGAAVKKRKR